MLSEMPISQSPIFVKDFNQYPLAPLQHSHAYSHRKRGQDGSEGPDGLYYGSCSLCLAVDFSGSAFILRIRVVMQDHQLAALGPLDHNDL